MFSFFPMIMSSEGVIKSFYGADFTPDPDVERIRAEKVQQCISNMGDRYLLAKPVQRIQNVCPAKA